MEKYKPSDYDLTAARRYSATVPAADLDANRLGYMTETQRTLLRERVTQASGPHYRRTAALLFWCVMTFIGCLWYDDAFRAWAIVALVALAAVTAVEIGWLIQRRNQLQADLLKRDVLAVSGRVLLEARNQGRQLRYAVHTGTHTFVVDQDTFIRFRQGETYTLYYAPHSSVILAAERLDAP